MTTDQKNSILYQSQVWVSEEAYDLLEKQNYSSPCDEEYAKVFKILNYQAVLLDPDVNKILTVKQQEFIYICIQNTLNLQNYPVAPLPFSMVESVDIIVGGQGPPGAPGSPGSNGTDANINVITTDPELKVIESIVMGVKTFNIITFPYIAATVSVSLDDATIPDPDQFRVVQTGIVLPTLQVFVNLIKNRDDVVASTFVNPPALDAAYQGLLDLFTLNSTGSQNITVVPTDVDVTTTYNVNIDDSTTVNSGSATITFVYPFLYGSTAGTSIDHYIDLTKLVQTKTNKTVIFNASVEYFWFAFPASYGTLTQILDQNGFDVTSAFTLFSSVTVNSAGLDSNWSISYNVYRTTLATTILNAGYTFKF